jgi:cell division protein FtsL
MSWTDRISLYVAAAAIVVTLGVGTCSTNARFNDVNARFDDVNRRIDDVNRRIDGIQADIRELRTVVVDAMQRAAPAES